jgi:hypothetical protein
MSNWKNQMPLGGVEIREPVAGVHLPNEQNTPVQMGAEEISDFVRSPSFKKRKLFFEFLEEFSEIKNLKNFLISFLFLFFLFSFSSLFVMFFAKIILTF